MLNYSVFKTSNKDYSLMTDTYICNHFGIAEFLATNYTQLNLASPKRVLDVGCGALPIGIFLADQHDCIVTGVDLNSIACNCATKNAARYGYEKKVDIINENFADYARTYGGPKFDLVVANPPIDVGVSNQVVQKYANVTFDTFDDEKYSYLTNSWHSEDGFDLLDYIFQFSTENLIESGCVVIAFCSISCSKDYVISKAKSYGFLSERVIDGVITPESIGINRYKETIEATIVQFSR